LESKEPGLKNTNTVKVADSDPNKKTSMQEAFVLIFKSMSDGAYFGEIDIIQNRRRTDNVKAISDCEAFTLSRTEFENVVISEFPHIYIDIKSIATLREQ
jgi:CRP-like cAMP-binding protein